MITKARGAKSRSNLKKGGGKGRGSRPSESARRMALKLLSRPKYRKTLQEKLDNCTLHPSVHTLLLQYAHGRPKEIIETQGAPTSVTIIHRLRGDNRELRPNSGTYGPHSADE
jgi:hypothetical protein